MAPSTDPRLETRNPLVDRYCSTEMSRLFSDQVKFSTWRRLWLALAECEKELGVDIPEEALAAMREHLDDVDFDVAEAEERKRRHDVMAHVHAFGVAAPAARASIHLGATSAFVGDNADLLLLREALRILARRCAGVVTALAERAREHRDLPCLGATHLQPAQPTTVGKRACLWTQDFLHDLREIERVADDLPLRGIKGTTGTQASFLELFEGDHAKVRRLDAMLAERLGFPRTVGVTGQTYPRKLDTWVLNAVAGLAESAGKMSSDVRILQAFGEISEPFGKSQTGSSAMAYKRNPMRSERMAALSRYLLLMPQGAAQTAATQWLERTLDDSAIRRLVLPQAMLAADAILILARDVAQGLEVFPKVIERRLAAELPFMATEVVLVEGVKRGGDRQDLHEAVREHSHEVTRRVREEGATNDLLDRLAADPRFEAVADLLPTLCDPRRFVGRAPEQVDEFLAEEVEPALRSHEERARGWGEPMVRGDDDDAPQVRV